MIQNILKNTIFKLVLGVILGLIAGNYLNERSIQVILSLKHILGQVIFFLIPLIVIGFVGASITKLSSNSSKVFGFSLLLAYFASIAAQFFSLFFGYQIIPKLHIVNKIEALKEIPEQIFTLDIPPIFSVMTALFLAFLLGLGVLWTKAKNLESILDELRDIISLLIKKLLIPIIPIFVALNFTTLSYEGSIQKHLPIFIKVVLIVIVMHWIWLIVLYIFAAIVSKKNPLPLIKKYLPVYFTAVGTMSSMAALGIAIEAISKSKILKPDLSNFTIPFFASIHLCGSVITIVFFTMTVSQVLYGYIPDIGTMVLFIFLLAIFAVSAPGVPGGTVIASLGLITAILGFDETGLALLLSIFALQDSFGTATNITSDGALALISEKYYDRKSTK
ncbi:Na+/H+-dicarboxylate symporter [Mesonia hippocampi]|uniref:Na+/H+-dicarboxylate symporter n=1 Tax=Mesonia hippocampi TaxID=1628250 RepID=A0A840EF71_9FLAO|nr:cation:dicarboxylase symporter family transporter [Mesonia hippocampi]MBB4117842.1 Na+/H+-dicarboxylate symporter [Mesonia hippocampi]